MITSANDDLRQHYIEKLRDIVEGRRAIPELLLTRKTEPGIIHASECELCPAKVFYKRTLTEMPPLSVMSILHFAKGRLFERMIGAALQPVEKDGITCEIDDIYNDLLVEIKSTTMDMAKFNPLTCPPWWRQRSKAYCYAHDTDRIGLAVWFLVGESWTKRGGDQKIGIKAWTLEFTKEELEHNWAYMLEQRELILAHIENKLFPSVGWIQSRLKNFECPSCNFLDICAYPQKGNPK
jgi:hypothetical protein